MTRNTHRVGGLGRGESGGVESGEWGLRGVGAPHRETGGLGVRPRGDQVRFQDTDPPLWIWEADRGIGAKLIGPRCALREARGRKEKTSVDRYM